MVNKTSLFSFIDFNFVAKNHKIYSSDPYVLFVKKLHEKFRESCLASRVSEETDEAANYEWPEQLDFLKLPHKSTFQLFTKNIFSVRESTRDLFSRAAQYDNLLLCWPHPLSYLIGRHFKAKKRLFLLVRQNQSEITKAKYQGIKQGFAMLGLKYLDYSLAQLKDSVQIITVGEEMNRCFLDSGFDSDLLIDSLIPHSFKGTQRAGPKAIHQLLYVGRLEKEKGVDILLGACAFLKNKGFRFQLQVIGTGSQRGALKELNGKLGLHENVDFLGHVKHGEALYSYFKASDLLVIPSRTEGFPKTIHEARAFGLPLVATPVGGMYAELDHGVNVWFSKSTDPTSFGTGIMELLSDHQSYATLSKNLLSEFEKSSMEFAIAKYYTKITGQMSAQLV